MKVIIYCSEGKSTFNLPEVRILSEGKPLKTDDLEADLESRVRTPV